MSATAPTAVQRALKWVVVALFILLLAWGGLRYGWSPAVHERFWLDISDRVHGPMNFRFLLQPMMALLAALPDGIRDARYGHRAFFWSALWDDRVPKGRLREGLTSIARVALLGMSMDVIYQLNVLDRFYPVEALMMALLLAVIPYFVLRWLTEILARRWLPASDERDKERRS
ncbi:hypothetical protein [Bosea robiniae]|uniref:Uncharacterized protein n=1 Tax=Bosea robiniae TaxID=1036780 RepID=A0ABY0NZ26_9HYPH|nr:hypothetical protein [Bosea robiniae]SDG44431.1 hypothetical protein SAMN05421844_10435 [Bosea robiniae]